MINIDEKDRQDLNSLIAQVRTLMNNKELTLEDLDEDRLDELLELFD